MIASVIIRYHLRLIILIGLFAFKVSFCIEFIEDNKVINDQYCNSETFQPRCRQNEVIFIRNATYGRMAIGKCITSKEIEVLGSQHLGCSTNVVKILDEKCTGKAECDIFVALINDQLNVKPCFEGLSVYLEVTYDCISVADESRSCSVDVTTHSIYLMNSRKCGTKTQPWAVEAPLGQKISVSLITHEYNVNHQDNSQQGCHRLGFILDTAGKRNITICADEAKTKNTAYKSTGNAIQIFQEPSLDSSTILFARLEAIGCVDIIPPEDAYLKRNDDELVVGCYTSRSTWYLFCQDGKWIGVIGNCSHDTSVAESFAEPKVISANISSQQIVGIAAFSGFTLTVCLTIACIGAVLYRRFRFRSRKQLSEGQSFILDSDGRMTIKPRVPHDRNTESCDNNLIFFDSKQHPTYSVFVGDESFAGNNC